MQPLFDSELCAKCKGRGYCGRPCKILEKLKDYLPKSKTHFSGSSPPEIFVGRYGYPSIFAGIISPEEYGDTEIYSMPELWHTKQLSIQDIVTQRSKMIYARFKTNIKKKYSKLLGIMQEISLAKKPVASEFFLKKPMHFELCIDKHIPIIGNPAPLRKARLEENPKIEKKVDYLTSDTDVRAQEAINELYFGGIEISSIIKILSAGMIGMKTRRKLVPSRWSTTAIDDAISKNLLKQIKGFPIISEFQVFSSNYLGNYYEFLLLPDFFSFEVIEAKISGSVWNPFSKSTLFMKDFESFFGRKNYAENVTGAYYANRLALSEYLWKARKQASCLVLREARPEYNAPCGVGILREVSRQAFKNKPEKFDTLNGAKQCIKTRLSLDIDEFFIRSSLLRESGKQKRLAGFFKL